MAPKHNEIDERKGKNSKGFHGGGDDDNVEVADEADYAEAVTRHAKYLGIDPEHDAAYMWIAEEALNADAPEGWVTGEGEGEYQGLVYYYNETTGESTWDHPLDDFYRDKFNKKKGKKGERKHRKHSTRESGKRRSCRSRESPSSSSRTRHDRGGNDGGSRDRSQSKREDSDTGRSPTRRGHTSTDSHYRGEESASSSHGRSQRRGRDRRRGDAKEERGSREGRRRRNRTEEGREERRRRREDAKDNRDDHGRERSDEGWEQERGARSSSRRTNRNDGGGAERYQQHGTSGSRREHDEDGSNRTSRERHEKDHEGGMQAARKRDTKRNRDTPRRGKHRNPDSDEEDDDEKSATHAGVNGSKESRSPTKSIRDEEQRPPSTSTSRSRHPRGSSPSDRGPGKEGNTARNSRRKREEISGNGTPPEEEEESHDEEGRSRIAARRSKREVDLQSNRRGRSKDRGKGKEKEEDGASMSEKRRGNKDDGRRSARGRASADVSSSIDRAVDPIDAVREIGVSRAVDDSRGKVNGGNKRGSEAGASAALGNRTGRGDVWNVGDLQEMDFEDEFPDEGDDLREQEDTVDPNGEREQKGRLSPIVVVPSTIQQEVASRSDVSVRAGVRETTESQDETQRSPKASKNASTVAGKTNDRSVADYHGSSPPPRNDAGAKVDEEEPWKEPPRIPRSDTRFAKEEARQDPRGSSSENLARGSREQFSVSHASRRRTSRSGSDEERGRWRETSPGAQGNNRVARGDTHDNAQQITYVSRDGGEKERSRNREERHRSSSREGRGYRGGDGSSGGWGGGGNRGRHRSQDRRRSGSRGETDQGIRRSQDRRRRREETGYGRHDDSDVRTDHDDKNKQDRYVEGRSVVEEGRRFGYVPRQGEHLIDNREEEWYEHGAAGRHFDRGWGGTGGRAEGGRFGREDPDETLGKVVELEKVVARLERDLAETKTREDNLREEVADAARRQAIALKKQLAALEEERMRRAHIEDSLAVAISETNKLRRRVAETESEWESKMLESEGTRKSKERALRTELSECQKRLQATDEALARNKENHALELEEEDADNPSLRTRLVAAEAELDVQGRALTEAQRHLAQANTKASASLREAHKSKDAVEEIRLEAAESSARAATLEAALDQAATDISALTAALSRSREDTARSKDEKGKSSEEMHRLRVQLGVAQNKAKAVEDDLQRQTASFESLTEGMRARGAELESANASMEREMHNGQEDALSRLRESERGRDAALYEARRSAEQASTAEMWRQKELHRAEAAEALALKNATEASELRAEVSRLRTGTDAAVAPHMRKNTELQGQVDDARRDVEVLTAGVERMKTEHLAEVTSLKQEVCRKIPQIAEKAAAEAGRRWRKRADEEIAAVKAERDRRLSEVQAAVVEAEARRHADLVDVRVDAERFKTIAEKLAAENRSIRGELKRSLATTKTTTTTTATNSATLPVTTSTARDSVYPSCGGSNRPRGATTRPKEPQDGSSGGDGGGRSSEGERWDSDNNGAAQHVKMLAAVEAHISDLRAQLQHQPSLTCAIPDTAAAAAASSGVRGIVGDGDGITVAASATTSSTMERSRVVCYCPTTSKKVIDGNNKNSNSSDGLTEMEDMRLNRLLRATTASVSKKKTPPPPPSPSSSPAKKRADPSCSNRSSSAGPKNGSGTAAATTDSSAWWPINGNDHHQTDTRDDEQIRGGGLSPYCHQSLRQKNGVAHTAIHQDLFVNPVSSPSSSSLEAGDGGDLMARDAMISTASSSSSIGVPRSPTTTTLGGGFRSEVRRSRAGKAMGQEEGDDLADISDGGFHPGCWKRKYASGDFR